MLFGLRHPGKLLHLGGRVISEAVYDKEPLRFEPAPLGATHNGRDFHFPAYVDAVRAEIGSSLFPRLRDWPLRPEASHAT